MRLTLWTGLGVLLIDQASKLIVVRWLGLIDRQTIDVMPPFLSFRMAWNRGVNFGLLAGHDPRPWLIALAVVISALVLAWVWRRPPSRLAAISAGLLVGGAAGNVVDRLFYGAVADFLNMSCCGLHNPFAFNLADVGVFLGAVGLILFTGDKKPATRGGANKTP